MAWMALKAVILGVLISLQHVASLLPSGSSTSSALLRLMSRTRYSALKAAAAGSNSNKSGNNNSINAAAAAYAMYWENILLQEHQQTVADFRERRRSWSRSRLEETGMSIFGAAAEPDSDLLGEKIVRIRIDRRGLSLNKTGGSHAHSNLDDKFTRGDVLLMTGTRNEKDNMSRDCLVVDVGKDWLNVAVGATWPVGLWEARKHPGACLVRLDRTAPIAPLRAQRTALDLVRRGKAGEAAELLANLRTDNNIDDQNKEWTERASTCPFRFKHLDSLAFQQSLENALVEAKQATTFTPNKSQEEAILGALTKKISLIQGPAGTGKSRVAALLVSTALRLQPQTRILVVAHSNGAADVLLEALLQMRIPALRVGRPATVSPSLQHRTVVALTEKHPEMVRLRAVAHNVTLDQQERSLAAHELRTSYVKVQQSILKTAPVVVTSCIGAHQLALLDDANFPLVVLDEAAQSTEPAFVCALAAARAEQMVLVGDICQLPPTVTSMDLRSSLGVSPMARLEKVGVAQTTLCVQYRMHPALLEHASKYFYKGLVVCADEERLGADDTAPTPPAGFPWPTNLPLAFVQIGVNSEVTHGFGGKSNPGEAALVTRIISDLLEAEGVEANKIAVISPYSKQVQRIRSGLALKRHSDVRVGTVDSFQGQETDVVVISCVRSNENGELGFLRDSRRLCVAITRARLALIVVGDRKVLQTCRHWAALLDSIDKRGGCVVDTRVFDRESTNITVADATPVERIPVGSLAQPEADPMMELFGEDEDDEFADLLR